MNQKDNLNNISTEELTAEERQAYEYLKGFSPEGNADLLKRAVRGRSKKSLDSIYEKSVYNRKTLVLLSIFFGGFGVDRFYIGDYKRGVLKILLNVFTLGIWWVLDIINLYKRANQLVYHELVSKMKAVDELTEAEYRAYSYIAEYSNPEDYGKILRAVKGIAEDKLEQVYNVKVYKPIKMILISYFLGECGVDHFYVGDVKGGLLKLFLGVFTLGLWYLYDLCNIDYNTRRLNYYNLVWPIHRRLGE